jgi:multidrug efflux pump subunit AcrA (membrane-fusion protein)
MTRGHCCFVIVILLLHPQSGILSAHEGHDPIPTKGAVVDVKQGSIGLSTNSMRLLDIRTGEIAQQRHREQIRAHATIESPWSQRAFVASSLPGQVAAIHVRSGDRVEAGQLLAEVVSRDLELLHREQLDALRELDYTRAVQALLNPTRQTGAIPEMKIVEADSVLMRASNRLRILEKKALALHIPWHRSTHSENPNSGQEHWGTLDVRSPIAGVVLQQEAVLGQNVASNTHLFQIVNNDSLWIRVHVLEGDAYRVSPGMNVELRLNAIPNQVWKSKLETLSQGVEPRTQQIAAWCTLQLDAVQSGILPGMTGQAILFSESREPRLSVPRSAVWSDGIAHYVFVETASTKQGSEYQRRLVWVDTSRRAVTTPTPPDHGSDPEFVELTGGGLFSNDRVVIQGTHELAGLLNRTSLRLDDRTARSLGVSFARAEERSIDRVLSIPTRVELVPAKRWKVGPTLTGTLKKLIVDRPRVISSGAILAELFSPEAVDMQLAWLDSLLDYELQSEMLQRLSAPGGNISPRVLLDLRNAIEKIKMRAASQEHQLELIGFDRDMLQQISKEKSVFDTFPVRSPSDAVVIDFMGTIGDVIPVGEDLFELHDPSGFQVVGFIPAKDSAKVFPEQRVRAKFDAYPDREFSGRVTRVSPTATKPSGVRQVWIDLDEFQNDSFRDRMLGRAAIAVDSGPTTLAIPRSAIVTEGTQSFVFVRGTDGNIQRRQIATGVDDGEFVAVLSGIRLGEEVASTQVMGLQTAYASLR